ncbi:hypothetical protein PInf_010553 [Phytophthora infestans]|nr:hypothetical protein PInf_010553 [Phytophthora infestans]
MNAVIALALGASSLAVAVADPRVMIESTYTDAKGLNDLAKAAGNKYMGTATDIKQLSDTSYTVTDLAMQWDATEPKQGVFTFEDADKFVAFCQQNWSPNSLARASLGKNLMPKLPWKVTNHQQVPEWVQSLEKAELLEAMSKHITKVMTHFGDTCYAWDVVNEAIEEDGSYRESFWYKKTGKEYISAAFKTAHAVKIKLGLKAKLYYNDYNINVANNKSDAVLKMVTDLRSHKVWVEGVGFQSHYSNNDSRAAATGRIITNAISACKKTKRCVGATIWDFVDTYSWIKSSAPLLFYQPDGPNTPLVRKATYDAVTSGWICVLASAFGDPRVMIESTYTDTKGLNDLAKSAWQNRGGKYMGTATGIKQLSDPYYIQKLNGTSDFGMITPHKQVPEWVQVLQKAELLEAMSNHITKVMTHFGNSCTAWDVVNEAIAEDGSYRESFWYKKTGKEYISTAFKTANEVKANLSLEARLYYNDSTSTLRFTVKHMDVAVTELDVKTSMANPTVSEQQQQVGIITNVVSACKKPLDASA